MPDHSNLSDYSPLLLRLLRLLELLSSYSHTSIKDELALGTVSCPSTPQHKTVSISHDRSFVSQLSTTDLNQRELLPSLPHRRNADTLNSTMSSRWAQFGIGTDRAAPLYGLVQAAKLVGSDDKNKDDPGVRVLAKLASEVDTYVRKEAIEGTLGRSSTIFYDHKKYVQDAEASVKKKVRDEKISTLRRNIKKAMSDAVKVVEKYEDNKDEAYVGNTKVQLLGMKRDRDAAMDDEIDAKLKEVESLRKRLREAK